MSDGVAHPHKNVGGKDQSAPPCGQILYCINTLAILKEPFYFFHFRLQWRKFASLVLPFVTSQETKFLNYLRENSK